MERKICSGILCLENEIVTTHLGFCGFSRLLTCQIMLTQDVCNSGFESEGRSAVGHEYDMNVAKNLYKNDFRQRELTIQITEMVWELTRQIPPNSINVHIRR